MTGANLEIANSCKPLISCIALIQAYSLLLTFMPLNYPLKKLLFFIVFILQHIHKDIFSHLLPFRYIGKIIFHLTILPKSQATNKDESKYVILKHCQWWMISYLCSIHLWLNKTFNKSTIPDIASHRMSCNLPSSC